MKSLRRFFHFLQDHAYIVLLLIFALHLPYLFSGFTWLDHRDIEQGAGLLPLHLLFPHAFLNPYADTYFYRPLITILHSFDYALYHGFSSGYHLTNLLLFLGIVGTAPFFMRSFFPLSKNKSFLLMVIIGIHPLTWLPVGSISYRPELAMTLCTFLSIGFYAHARMSDKTVETRRFVSLSVLFGLLALFAKETTLYLLPMLILFWEVLKKRERKLKEVLPILLPIIGIILLYILLRLVAVPKLWESSTVLLSPSEWIGTRIYVITKLLLHLLLPILPRLDDSVPITTLANPVILLAILGSILLFVLLRNSSFRSPLMICLTLILLTLVPALNLIHLPRFYSPHYAFAAVIPFSMTLVLATNLPWKKYAYGLLFIWCGIAALQTINGGFRFKNDLSLFAPEAKASPYYKEGDFYLGNYYASHNQYIDAVKAYQAALVLKPNSIAYDQSMPVLLNLTTILLKENKYNETEEYLKTIETMNSSSTYSGEIRLRKAYLASARHEPKLTIEILSPSLNTLSLSELTLLATAYHDIKDNKKATEVLKKTLPYLSPEKRTQMENFIDSQPQGSPN